MYCTILEANDGRRLTYKVQYTTGTRPYLSRLPLGAWVRTLEAATIIQLGLEHCGGTAIAQLVGGRRVAQEAHMEKGGKLICVVVCCTTIEPGLRLQPVVAASVFHLWPVKS